MSRVGKNPITIPSGVSVTIDNQLVSVNGPKGNLSQPMLPGVFVKQEEQVVIVSRENDEQLNRANHGLMRALVANMVEGVSQGFSKKLELNGVGYRVNLAGSDLRFNLGFSHEIKYPLPEGISAQVEQNVVTISGISRQQVGQVAAEIRALKRPEPYKGKGIKYADERIIRKSGKSGKDKAA